MCFIRWVWFSQVEVVWGDRRIEKGLGRGIGSADKGWVFLVYDMWAEMEGELKDVQ